ncbi:hypothetical protein [Anabaena sp. CCY 0017]|uniref:hypothetical protein n=1 Tax=Anabaena sp. CCY 0017 TaxID=3103866 RepID=UPI0039C70528
MMWDICDSWRGVAIPAPIHAPTRSWSLAGIFAPYFCSQIRHLRLPKQDKASADMMATV